MKKQRIFGFINIILPFFMLLSCIIYFFNYDIRLKALTASWFVVSGGVNLLYAVICRKKLLFPVFVFAGLALCMAGDIVLFKSFLPGAVLFVLGHIAYIASYSAVKKPSVTDLAFILPILLLSVLFVLFYPAFDYGSTVMTAVAAVYAAVISFMLGKALSNAFMHKTKANIFLLLGSILFFVSDIALAFNVFGGSPLWSDRVCMFTYFPGQCVIALSVYLYANSDE